jgi:hypothetical protein
MPAAMNFKPSTHGLHFANYWPPGTPALVFTTPIGNVPIGNAGNGLCGGFCFTALDLLESNRRPPSDLSAPAGGSPLVNYLTWRLIASWNIPAGILTYYAWANTPDEDTFFGARPGLARMTISEQIPKITRCIDSGQPCTLGLVTVRSPNPADLARCHQVLAYGYEWQDSTVTLQVYDPNTPDGDDVWISLDTRHVTPARSNVACSYPIRGFFAVDYRFSDPGSIAGPPWQGDEESGGQGSAR